MRSCSPRCQGTQLHRRQHPGPPPTHPTSITAPAPPLPLPLQLPGIAGGFVSAYGLWSVMTKDSATKLPHTITNPEWAAATKGACCAVPCVAVPAWARTAACMAADAAAHALVTRWSLANSSLTTHCLAVPPCRRSACCRASQGAAPHRL